MAAAITVGGVTVRWRGVDSANPWTDGEITIEMPVSPTYMDTELAREVRELITDTNGWWLAHGGAPPIRARSWAAVRAVCLRFAHQHGLAAKMTGDQAVTPDPAPMPRFNQEDGVVE